MPNLLSFLRLCMVPLFLWIYLGLDEPLWAAGLLVLSGITDTVDGWIARKFHQVSNLGKALDPFADKVTSNLGKALDPFADKVTQIAVVTCLSIRFPRLWIVSGVLLAKESFALITSLMAIHSSGEVQGADWHGKLTTTLMYITMTAHLVFPNIPDSISVALTVLCTCMILLSGVRISTVTALAVWAVLMVLLFRNMGSVSLHELLTYQPEKPVLAALSMLLLFALKSMDAVIHCGVLFAATGLMLPLPYAFAVNMLGVVLMSVIPYFVGIQLGTDAADSLRQKHPRLREAESFQTRHAVLVSALLRAIGLPTNITGVYLGAIQFEFLPYLEGSALGMLPILIFFTLIGTSADDVHSPLFIVSVIGQIVLTIASALIYAILRKRDQEKHDE